MDWEKKFNSILKDTDANLSRVKNRFQSSGTNNVTWVPQLYSTPMKRSTSLADIELATTPKYPQRLSLNQSFSGDQTVLYGGPGAASSYPFQSLQILQEKLEQQNTNLEHLRGVIHRLETDRENYKEQVRDLRNEVYQLTEKASSRRADPGLERRVESMRREFLGEIQLLQSQLQITSSKGNRSNMSDTQLMSLNRDVLEIKHAYRDELEGLRRDVEVLRSRVSRVELELTSVLSTRRGSLQQDRLDRPTTSISQPQQTSQVQHQSSLAAMNANRNFDRMQINELRSALGNLKEKIDVLESSSQHVSNLPPKMTKLFSDGKKFQLFGQATKNSLENGLLDELDLSDDDEIDDNDSDSSDFTEFEPTSASKKNKIDIELNEVGEDDLDIDDLDLSDDDLSESFDKDDFT